MGRAPAQLVTHGVAHRIDAIDQSTHEARPAADTEAATPWVLVMARPSKVSVPAGLRDDPATVEKTRRRKVGVCDCLSQADVRTSHITDRCKAPVNRAAQCMTREMSQVSRRPG